MTETQIQFSTRGRAKAAYRNSPTIPRRSAGRLLTSACRDIPRYSALKIFPSPMAREWSQTPLAQSGMKYLSTHPPACRHRGDTLSQDASLQSWFPAFFLRICRVSDDHLVARAQSLLNLRVSSVARSNRHNPLLLLPIPNQIDKSLLAVALNCAIRHNHGFSLRRLDRYIRRHIGLEQPPVFLYRRHHWVIHHAGNNRRDGINSFHNRRHFS